MPGPGGLFLGPTLCWNPPPTRSLEPRACTGLEREGPSWSRERGFPYPEPEWVWKGVKGVMTQGPQGLEIKTAVYVFLDPHCCLHF